MRTAGRLLAAGVVLVSIVPAHAADVPLPQANPKRWASIALPEPNPTRAAAARERAARAEPAALDAKTLKPAIDPAGSRTAGAETAPERPNPAAAPSGTAAAQSESTANATTVAKSPVQSTPVVTASSQASTFPPQVVRTVRTVAVAPPEPRTQEAAVPPRSGARVAVAQAIALPTPKPRRTRATANRAAARRNAVAIGLPIPNPRRSPVPVRTAAPRAAVSVALPAANPRRPRAAPAPAPIAIPPIAAAIALPEPKPRKTVALPSPKPTRAPSTTADAVPQAQKVAKRPGAAQPEALKRLLAYPLSSSDKANLKEVLRTVYKGRHGAARSAKRRIKDPAARKLAEWYYLRSGPPDVSAQQIEAFRRANPHWPGQKLMRRRAEGRLFLRKPPAKTVFAFFEHSAPTSGPGTAALGAAHLASGNEAEGRKLIASAWRDYALDKRTEKLFLDRHGKLLTKADHKARIDKLIYQDRKSKLAPALRLASRLGKAERKKVEARAAVVRRSRKAGRLLKGVKASTASDVGLFFNRIQWLRRKDRDKEAWTLILEAPKEPAKLVDPNEWWIERRIHVRSALNAGHVQTAYDIAIAHGPVTGRYLTDAKFMAGWIALRFLNRFEEANTHFQELRKAAKWPKTIARADYWLGRAALAMGKPDVASGHFKAAGVHYATYYGQLALQAINPEPQTLNVPATPVPSQEDVKAFLDRDAVNALGVVRAAGLNRMTRPFLYQLARSLDSAAEVGILAEAARRFDQLQASIRMSKVAFNRGLALTDYAFPTDVLPKYKRLNDGVEPALLHALSRQESEFNPVAKSPVGARGLMQLMPPTARVVARTYKVRYRKASLTKASYNVMLGAAHLRDLVDEFGGSYIMALAAYNAGGPRVREWMAAFGDPRAPNIDPIDWVEQIPFTETRRYVQKILESIQVFRAQLEGPDRALQVLQDLHRGRSATAATVAAADADTQPASAGPTISLGLVSVID